MMFDWHLNDGSDDLSASGSTDDKPESTVGAISDDDGGHRGERPTSSSNEMSRAGRQTESICCPRDREVMHFVVEENACPRAHNARAEPVKAKGG